MMVAPCCDVAVITQHDFYNLLQVQTLDTKLLQNAIAQMTTARPADFSKRHARVLTAIAEIDTENILCLSDLQSNVKKAG